MQTNADWKNLKDAKGLLNHQLAELPKVKCAMDPDMLCARYLRALLSKVTHLCGQTGQCGLLEVSTQIQHQVQMQAYSTENMNSNHDKI
jgi:hypothetical protein